MSKSGLNWPESWVRDNQAKRDAERGVVGSPQKTSRRQSSVRLVLPWPPSVNTSGADAFRGGKKSDGYNAFVREVADRVHAAGDPVVPGRLEVGIDGVPPDNRPRDIDNGLKATLDALQHAKVYENDCLIDDLRIRRMPVLIPGNGSLVVNIRDIATRSSSIEEAGRLRSDLRDARRFIAAIIASVGGELRVKKEAMLALDPVVERVDDHATGDIVLRVR